MMTVDAGSWNMTTSEQTRVQTLLRARQVREFTDQPLTSAELEALTDVARWSGSSRNNQPWRFIVVRDRAVIERIHDAGAPQTRSLRTARQAIAIVLGRDPADLEDAFDEGRAAERVLIAAGLLGLAAGISWVQPSVRPVVGELLRLPPDRFVRTVIAVGHPSEAARRPKSAPGDARLPAAETVFEERWPQR
jgi:nitroreductase